MNNFIRLTGVLLAVLLIWGLILSRDSAPLLEEGRRNPFKWCYDRVAFSWYFTRANLVEERGNEERVLAELARAAWHRPSFTRQVFGLPPTDYSGLARRFESLGLNEEAARLFSAAYYKDPGVEQARASIPGCAGLEDWEGVSRIAADVVARRPDSGEGWYWWGRALLREGRGLEAAEKLEKAAALTPGDGDIHYWLGESYRAGGREGSAEAEYREAVGLSPEHREGWAALCRKIAKDGSAGEAQEKVSTLTADQATRIRFGDDLIFCGNNKLPPAVRGEESFPFTLYCEFLPGAEGRITPYLKLKSGHFQKRFLLEPVSPSDVSPGGVLVKPYRPLLPWDICPLPARVLIGFLDKSGEPLRIFGSRESELELEEVRVEAGLFSYPRPDPRLAGIDWKDLTDLRKRTVLAGGERVEVEVTGSPLVAAVGIISYTEGTIRVPQGTEIAKVRCLGPEGFRSEYPIRLGLETADRWLESRDPHVSRHQPASIFHSHRMAGKKSYRWHHYQALLPLSGPSRLEKLELEYTGPPSGCWVVNNVFLLESPPDPD